MRFISFAVLAIATVSVVALPTAEKVEVVNREAVTVPYIDDDGIQWTNAKSQNGAPFEIGFKPKTEHEETMGEDVSTVVRFLWDPVNWPVGDKTWKTAGVHYMSQYRLYDQDGTIYQYRLEFINTERNDFKFKDQTGDIYSVSTYRRGEHYFRYNSKKPAIEKVGYSTDGGGL